VNLDRIRERLSVQCKPFVLELSSGKLIRVPHSDFVSIGRNVVAVIGINDAVTTTDASHIVSLDDLLSPKRRT
jgi:hypothetical protein